MSLGTWDPGLASTNAESLLSADTLDRLIGYDRENKLHQLDELLSTDEQQRMAALMKVDHDAWRGVAEPLADAAVIHLLRFFAVAENLPGWEAGAQSPVIPLARILRKRGARLDKPMLQWLREVNDNRFLPYGPL
ncbi:hypothetical protein [Candidatus Marimicrobium litorale]|uniref:Uncharacterized protein n=1 Tax=Candidatus Marimicrobium litorale TaxID=2518991 RepID=A0ABT3T0P6_9GAMM|nr:hypothetical protein [Candidatus Marimicrobium litorale]MCX2975813.1 hypothetical protein [Candidatus Marimicrobium litorale]